jgi:hypothetical protein
MNSREGLSAPGRVICVLLGGRSGAEVLGRLDRRAWEDVVETACREGVAPLLAWALEEGGWSEAVPEGVRRELKAAWRTSAVRSVRMSRVLLDVLATLSQPPAVPVVLLKGAALAATVYPDPSLRPMCDFDLLVPAERLEDAVRRLRAEGYGDYGPDLAPDLNQATGHHVHLFDGADGGIHLELHWTLVGCEGQRYGPDIAWFWDEIESFDSDLLDAGLAPSSLPLVVLSPTAQLLHVAAHLMLQHGGASSRLVWFYDVHRLVEQESGRIDWTELVDRARQFHWSAALAAALERARDWFGTAIPQGVVDDLAGFDDGRSAWLVRRRADPLQTRATGMIAKAVSLDWPTRVRYLRGMVLPSPAFVRARYRPDPSWLWPLCYPYRWADMAWEGVTTVWRMVRGRPDRGAE